MTNPHAASQQTPLQTLIKKAENGEMPVMTMTGLKKQSEIDREKKLEEEREKAKASEAGPAPGPTAVEKTPTTVLAGICRQGGGPTLAEMVMTVGSLSLLRLIGHRKTDSGPASFSVQIDHQLFWTQLQQSCAKRNVNVFDEVHQGKFVVENKTVDLLQLFQTVVSRGGGYAKVSHLRLLLRSRLSGAVLIFCSFGVSATRSTPETRGLTSQRCSRSRHAQQLLKQKSRRSITESFSRSKTSGRRR